MPPANRRNGSKSADGPPWILLVFVSYDFPSAVRRPRGKLMLRHQLRRRDFIALLGGATAARPLAAYAQGWPSQVVRIICPLAAGGGIDATAHIAAEFVARSDPDGYTIYLATFPHATNRYLYSSLGYDPVADFAPVTLIGLYPLMMVVPNSSPAHSVKEFIAYAKVKSLSYASSGHGTSLHLAGEL